MDMHDNYDYSKCSLDDLLDIKDHIDPKEAPENYKRLMDEFKKTGERNTAK